MKNATVLLVDDEPNVLQGLRRALHGQPFDLVCVHSAEAALQVLEQQPVDVVVSDEQMTGISGTDLLRKVRSLYPDTLRFILTGKATLDTAVRAINQGGVCRFFLKPCHAIELVVAIRQELEKRELVVASKRLLKKVREQALLLAELELDPVSSARAKRDAQIPFILEEPSGEISELIKQICTHI